MFAKLSLALVLSSLVVLGGNDLLHAHGRGGGGGGHRGGGSHGGGHGRSYHGGGGYRSSSGYRGTSKSYTFGKRSSGSSARSFSTASFGKKRATGSTTRTTPTSGTTRATTGATRSGSLGTFSKASRTSRASSGGTRAGKFPSRVTSPGGTKVSTARYASLFGSKLGNGRVKYNGRNHRQWTRRAFSGRWRCWLWFDPCTEDWYYWAGSRGCYLPVDYLPVVEPTEGDEDGPPNADEVSQCSESQVPNLPGGEQD